MNIETYLDQFHVLGKDTELNCDGVSKILYGTILNRFRLSFSTEEYRYLKEYQERVFELIENMRNMDSQNIGRILDYLSKQNPYLADILILLWSMPRTDDYLSKKIYNNRYRSDIKKFNHKLTDIITNETIKNFCVETLTKNNYVPVHCIDLLWYYMDTLSLEFTFYNIESATYIGIMIHEEKKDGYNVQIGLDMAYILDMDLGQIAYDAKGPFKNIIEKFMTDPIIIEKIMASPEKNNYQRQRLQILESKKLMIK